MNTKLRTDITIRQLCEGFVYDENDEKGLFGRGLRGFAHIRRNNFFLLQGRYRGKHAGIL